MELFINSDFFQLNLATILSWVVAFIVLSTTLVIFVGSKKRSSRIFAFSSFIATLWIFLMGVDISIPNSPNVPQTVLDFLDFLPRLTYFLGSIIALMFFYFCLLFTKGEDAFKWMSWAIMWIIIITFPIYFFTDLLIVGESEWVTNNNIVNAEIWKWKTGILDAPFNIFFNSFFAAGVYLIYKKMREVTDRKRKLQFRLMFWSFIIGFIPPSIVSILLPSLEIYDYIWIGNLAPIIWTSAVAYSIVKYDQMNVRVVFTEILVLAALFLLFLSIFV